MVSLFDNFYQMGFVARDLEKATAAMARFHGVSKWRITNLSSTMEAAHAWIGSTMLELIRVLPGAPGIYDAYVPEDPAAVRLHHHGYRVNDEGDWKAINHLVEKAGFATPLKGCLMDGQFRYLYADTRALTGIYSEYTFREGAATAMYDGVPHN